jgi:hypothetical protein
MPLTAAVSLSISLGSSVLKIASLMDTAASITAIPGPQTLAPKARLEFVDNLRWVMIVLVVAMHAAVTYSHLGS